MTIKTIKLIVEVVFIIVTIGLLIIMMQSRCYLPIEKEKLVIHYKGEKIVIEYKGENNEY